MSQTSCIIAERLENLKVKKVQAIKDLRALCSTLPPPMGFSNFPSTESFDVSKVFIAYKYKSTNSCEDTANHYKKLLEAKGWDVSKMEQNKSRGGMRTIDTDFRHGEYVVTLSCEDISDNSLKQQDLYCSWGLK